MDRQILVTGSAVALAAVVLLLTILGEPATVAPKARQTIDNPIDPTTLHGFNPGQTSARIDPRGQAEQYHVNRYTDQGQLIEFFGDRLTPLPKGVTQVEAPGTRVHLATNRVLQLLASDGTIVAPDNQPRSGELVGDVVLTLFDAGADHAVDLGPGSDDVQLKLFLDNAGFDLELGLIESDSDVHLTGPRIDFRGTGLSLTYNELRKRIERFEITRGQSLRFKPRAPVESEPDEPRDSATPDPSAPGSATSTPTPTKRRQRDIQFYRARFASRVTIRSQGVIIEADRLEAVFSMDRDQPGDDPLESLGLHLPARPIDNANWRPRVVRLPSRHVLHQAAAGLLTLLPATIEQGDTATVNAGQTLAPVGADDVIITWGGKLTVEPEESPPIDLAGPQDVLIELIGRPVTIVTDRDETMSAAGADYLASRRRVRMIGSEAYPMTVRSSQLGLLRGERLEVASDDATLTVMGPGSLQADRGSLDDDYDGATLLPDGLEVTWDDRMDIAFSHAEEQTDQPGGDGGALANLQSVRSADFTGSVTVRHPRFELTGEKIHIEPAHAEATERIADRITSDGEATLKTVGPGSVPLEVQADHLAFNLVRTKDGQPQDASLEAHGQVLARLPEQELTTEHLQIALIAANPQLSSDGAALQSIDVTPATQPSDQPLLALDPPATTVLVVESDHDSRSELESETQPQLSAALEQPADPGADSDAVPDAETPVTVATIPEADSAATADTDVLGQLTVSEIRASQGVQIASFTPEMLVTADRLVADLPNDQHELFGSSGVPAQVRWVGGSLTGKHLVMHRASDIIRVPGPGTLVYSSNPDAQGDGDTSDQVTGDAMTITWADAMHLDDRQGFAHFVGAVSVNAVSGLETTQLSAEDLRLEYTHIPVDQLIQGTPDEGAEPAGEPGVALMSNNRAVRTLAATDNTVLICEQRTDTGDLATRLRVSGPTLHFDNLVEQVQVLGEGTLLVEDYRQVANDDEGGHGDTRSRRELVGHGVTLFRWDGQLLVDLFHGEIRLVDAVQMLHRPADGGEPVQLDCQQLRTELADAGGLGIWLSGRAAYPTIHAIYADREVRLISEGRTIFTDHIVYTGVDRSVLMHADDGRQTWVHLPDDPTAHSAKSVRWDLDSNRLEIAEPTSGRVPVRRGRSR